ncbi:hypothetical protein [Sporosarcina psychrophila]|uniref:DUF4145 domain-containing protein n=1 Tax=Sporosarcina psychrophila TaxID=1476 RepID=A0ABV2KBW0_SPOPS
MGSGGASKQRKVRSDRKRDIKPTVPHELRECIYRLAYITDTPVKDVAEAVCINGIHTPKVIGHLSQYFRRDIRFTNTNMNTIYRSNPNCMPISRRALAGQTARITIRFKSETYDTISAIAYALDCTVSRTCALLLDASVRDGDFINEFVRKYLEANLDAERVRELKKILRYVNADNPYGEEYTWVSLLSLMIDEVREVTAKVADAATDFIVKNWRDK